jgi:hypothetical protein
MLTPILAFFFPPIVDRELLRTSPAIFVGYISFFVFAFTGELQHYYRALILQDRAGTSIYCALTLLILMTFAIAILALYSSRLREAEISSSQKQWLIVSAFVATISVLPILGVARGISLAEIAAPPGLAFEADQFLDGDRRGGLFPKQIRDWASRPTEPRRAQMDLPALLWWAEFWESPAALRFNRASMLMSLMAAVFGVGIFLVASRLRTTSFATLMLSWRIVLGLPFLGCTIGACSLSVDKIQYLGALSVMACFFLCLTLLLISLVARTGTHFLFVTVAAGILLTVSGLRGWNDNNEVRSYLDSRPIHKDLKLSFLKWLKSRQDVAHYAGKKYPIYVVAAQGGHVPS